MTSPVKVYHTETNLKGTNCDSNGICRTHFTFEWLNPEAVCSSNFVCLTLDANVCQEYGVNVAYATAEGIFVKNESVCEPMIIHDGTIGVGQKAIVTLWFKEKHSPFNADCYFWCTQNGQLPKDDETVLLPKYNLVSLLKT